MWETLTWRKLRAAELDSTITGLRGDMLTLFLAIISVGFGGSDEPTLDSRFGRSAI